MMTDAAARARALDPHTSFIVRAPAGSGKTELLIQRYLRLLATVDAPESIVAITFTRKAAAEMRARVVEALHNARGPRPEPAHKATTWELARAALHRSDNAGWRLLENPARIRMQTIDSLCVAITSQMPWLARFGAVPEITEKAGPLYQEAARLTLTGPDKSDDVASLLLHLDNNFGRAQSLIAQMLDKRDQWLRHVMEHTDVREQVESCLQSIIQDTLDELRQAARDAALDPPPDDALEGWMQLAEDLLTKSCGWRKKSPVAQRHASNDLLLECFKRLRKLPPPHFTDTQWRAMESIVELLPIAVGNLGIVFRERATVDFIELTLASLHALRDAGGPSDLGLALGYRIRHILFDEFQDTSYTQLELLGLLTQTWDPGDGRSLFLVGDPMQSIYRFRQAEVGLFLRAWQNGIGNVVLEPLTLSVNFRSGAAIVEWVNHSFEKAFPQDENPIQGAVRYSASSACDRSCHAAVEVHAFTGETGRADEAERAAAIAREARERGTVGILVRARSHLPAIIRALREHGIRYQAIEIDELGQRAIIQDLMALTFAILHPADRISQLAVLRAPWRGLTLADLLQPQPLPSAVSEAIAARGRRTLRDLVEQTWIRIGGPACVTSESDLADAAAYFDLLEIVDEGGDLPDFEVLRTQVGALFAQPDTAADGRVQIMTIHKAKGLEFDTVILPAIDAQAKKDDNQLILWHEPRETELLFAPITESGSEETDPIYRYLLRLEQRKADHESVRLLYVAATRAATELHLLGCASVKADGSISPASSSFLKILWPVVQSKFQTLQPAPAHVENAHVWVPRTIRKLAADWSLPEPPPGVQWTRTGSVVSEVPEITYEWVGDTLRHVGTAVHVWLARIARDGLDRWPLETLRSRARAIRTMLANLGVSPADLDSATRLVLDALSRVTTDERGRWLLGPHASAECELAISGVMGGQVYETVIDRTFIDDAGVRWIVDYKTGSHTGGSVEQFLANEKQRYREQLELYARLLAQQDERPTKLALYFPLVTPGWIEWDASVATRRQASLFADFEGAVLG
jgi:ATP-dependent exoDNAse (exonuclease V) beta subunit